MGTLELTDEQEFIVQTDSCDWLLNRISKLKDACIFLCRQGEAQIEIDSEEYHIIPHTHLVLLPDSIVGSLQVSDGFRASYILFSQELFQEVTTRLEPSFYRFLKETPVVTLPDERTASISRMIATIEDLYNDRNNCFRQQILRNYIQSFLLDIYDKTRRLFLQSHPEGISRQEELFKQFILLVHRHCTEQREVAFYADKLCIGHRYLSTIVHNITGNTAKSIIDMHVILEIKALLKSTHLSVQEISNRLHFPDQSFFGRYFKKHTGVSPLRFRNEW